MRPCKQCGKDISHRPAKAQYCDNRCKDAWNNAHRLKSPPSAFLVPSGDAGMPSNTLESILAAIQETNRLLALMMTQGQSGRVVVTEQVITRQVAVQPALPLPDISPIELEITKSNAPSHSAKIAVLQLQLTASPDNVRTFSEDDLQLVKGHRAFNQAMIEAELARRMSTTSSVVVSGGNAKPLAGASIQFSEPDEIDLEL
jgi:hypothetical protein